MVLWGVSGAEAGIRTDRLSGKRLEAWRAIVAIVEGSRSYVAGVVDAVVGADVVDGEDVGVVEGGDGAGLALEAAQPLGVGGGIVGEDLEGDVAPEAGVAGPVDLPHTSGAEGCHDLVRADAAARGQQSSFPPALRPF